MEINNEIYPLGVIADKYGFEAQSRQLIEEMSELTVAINKGWRLNKGYIRIDEEAQFGNLIEEIGDVELCLEQIKYLINKQYIDFGEKLRKIKEKKIERELTRINES